MSTMPCISIRQPWANLIVQGLKDIENRSWRHKMRGRVLVHAAKGMTQEEWLGAILFAHRTCNVSREVLKNGFEFDPAEFKKYEDRAAFIIGAATPPARISEDPAWFECKFCAYQPICHGVRAPQVNCRTCAHSTPRLDGDAVWQCEKYECELPVENQRSGCSDHRYIPILLEKIGTAEGIDGSLVTYVMHDSEKTQFANGEPPDGFTSEEIRAAGSPAMLKDRRVRDLREEFSTARIVPAEKQLSGTGFDDMDDDVPWHQ